MKQKRKNLIGLLALVIVLNVVISPFLTRRIKAEDSGEVKPCRIFQPGNLPPEYEVGITAVNEKLAEDGIGIEVSVQRSPWDAYATKLNLMLTTGEPFELLHVMQDVKNLSAIAGMGSILPVDDLVEDYPDLVNKFTEIEWRGTIYDQQHYAIPVYWRTFDNLMSYITYRKDVMEKVGYEEFPTEDLDALVDLMKKSQDYILNETGTKGYHWIHQTQDTAHWLHRTYDSYPFYVENSLGMVLARQDGTIDSFYESEEFKKDAEFYERLYQEGLIHPDILNVDHSVKYDQAQLGAFLPSQTLDSGVQVSIRRDAGIEDAEGAYTKMMPEKPEMIYTFVQNLSAIPSTADDPESGVKFLDWLYDNQDNHDLFHYGIEGVHYKKIGDDRIEQILGEDNLPLYNLDTWMTGYLPYMRYSEELPDSQIKHMEYKAENYVVSPIAGFIFDSSEVATELTNLETEIIASIYPIKFGLVPYEDNIDGAIERLKAAGLDHYLEEYRLQFEKYLEDNPGIMETVDGTTAE